MGGGGSSHLYHSIIYHQFVWLRVREEPQWQGASLEKWSMLFFRQRILLTLQDNNKHFQDGI